MTSVQLSQDSLGERTHPALRWIWALLGALGRVFHFWNS